MPHAAFPAASECEIFQPINFRIGHGNKTGLERAEPFVVPPVEGQCAQGETRQFGERVMRHRFASVHEERDFIATKRAVERGLMRVERAHDHGALTIATAVADMAQNFARGKDRLGFSIGTGDELDGGSNLRTSPHPVR